MELKKSILKGDKYLWGTYVALCFISIISMYSASSRLSFGDGATTFDPVMRHTVFLLLGSLLVFAIHNIHYKYFRLVGFPILVVSCLLLIYTRFSGMTINEASRWTTIYGINLQPSELAKMGAVISISYFLAKGQCDEGVDSVSYKKALLAALIPCILIFTENFSTAFILGSVAFCMMLVAGVRLKKLALLLVSVAVFVIIVLLLAKVLDKDDGTQKDDKDKSLVSVVIHRANTWNSRIAEFVSTKNSVPEYFKETNDDNYQVHHSHMAIAHSHGIGVGPGNSRERDYLPQAFTDFIYSIIIEEFGILGGLFVMFLYLSILFRALRNVKKCTYAFPAFLMLGIAMLIVFQAVINMSVATGLIPVTGQPLPLISRGGTSVLTTCCYFGMMLSISRFATNEDLNEAGPSVNMKTEPDEVIPEDISAPNPNIAE